MQGIRSNLRVASPPISAPASPEFLDSASVTRIGPPRSRMRSTFQRRGTPFPFSGNSTPFPACINCGDWDPHSTPEHSLGCLSGLASQVVSSNASNPVKSDSGMNGGPPPTGRGDSAVQVHATVTVDSEAEDGSQLHPHPTQGEVEGGPQKGSPTVSDDGKSERGLSTFSADEEDADGEDYTSDDDSEVDLEQDSEDDSEDESECSCSSGCSRCYESTDNSGEEDDMMEDEASDSGEAEEGYGTSDSEVGAFFANTASAAVPGVELPRWTSNGSDDDDEACSLSDDSGTGSPCSADLKATITSWLRKRKAAEISDDETLENERVKRLRKEAIIASVQKYGTVTAQTFESVDGLLQSVSPRGYITNFNHTLPLDERANADPPSSQLEVSPSFNVIIPEDHEFAI